MSQKAPGKAHRKGISLVEIMRKFPDDASAETYFVEQRWPNGVACPHCGSTNVQSGTAHKTMPYRCRGSSVRSGSARRPARSWKDRSSVSKCG